MDSENLPLTEDQRQYFFHQLAIKLMPTMATDVESIVARGLTGEKAIKALIAQKEKSASHQEAAREVCTTIESALAGKEITPESLLTTITRAWPESTWGVLSLAAVGAYSEARKFEGKASKAQEHRRLDDAFTAPAR